MSRLFVNNITAFYGASQALFGVDLTLEEGEVLALLGRNGMGKSTTIKAITQMIKIASGEITHSGKRIDELKSHQIGQLGVGLVPEDALLCAIDRGRKFACCCPFGEWTLETVAAHRLQERRTQIAASLSGGEQQIRLLAAH